MAGPIKMRYMHDARAADLAPLQLSDALVPDSPGTSIETTTETYHPSRRISDAEQERMFHEWAASGSETAVAAKYGVHKAYLRDAMRRKFGSLEGMKAALLGIVTENAIVAQMVAAAKMEQLSGAQAVFAGKMLVETMERVEKSIANTPKTINFGQLNRVGESIAKLRSIVGTAATVAAPASVLADEPSSVMHQPAGESTSSPESRILPRPEPSEVRVGTQGQGVLDSSGKVSFR